MYRAVVMTERFRIVQKGEQYEEIEVAKKAAAELPLEQGQMAAVIDDKYVVRWKGGVKAKNRDLKMSIEKG